MHPTTYTAAENDWIFSYNGRTERRESLSLVWELHYDPITDDYLPEETDANELLQTWQRKLPDETTEALFGPGTASIVWFVEDSGGAFEAAPFQSRLYDGDSEDFLSHYTWPRHAETGERLNWNRLPVKDKRWRPGAADKGGFFQEATGWKPGPLEPVAYVGAILAAAGYGTERYAPRVYGPRGTER